MPELRIFKLRQKFMQKDNSNTFLWLVSKFYLKYVDYVKIK